MTDVGSAQDIGPAQGQMKATTGCPAFAGHNMESYSFAGTVRSQATMASRSASVILA
jgi:hypothetical protein